MPEIGPWGYMNVHLSRDSLQIHNGQLKSEAENTVKGDLSPLSKIGPLDIFI